MARKELPGGTAAKAVAPPAGVLAWSDFWTKTKSTKSHLLCWVPIIVWKGIVCLFRHWLFLAVFVAFCVDPGGDPLDDFTRPQRLLRVVENERQVLIWFFEGAADELLNSFWRFLFSEMLGMLHSQNWPFMDCNMDHRYSHMGGRVRFTWLQRLLWKNLNSDGLNRHVVHCRPLFLTHQWTTGWLLTEHGRVERAKDHTLQLVFWFLTLNKHRFDLQKKPYIFVHEYYSN